MKVKELIERLKDYDDNLEVYYSHDISEFPIVVSQTNGLSVHIDESRNVVIIYACR